MCKKIARNSIAFLSTPAMVKRTTPLVFHSVSQEVHSDETHARAPSGKCPVERDSRRNHSILPIDPARTHLVPRANILQTEARRHIFGFSSLACWRHLVLPVFWSRGKQQRTDHPSRCLRPITVRC